MYMAINTCRDEQDYYDLAPARAQNPQAGEQSGAKTQGQKQIHPQAKA